MRPPLEGITVVALEQAVAAPFATRQLADLGARVIKVERPGGGDFARGYDHAVHGLSSYFFWLNRSKQSLTLDIKHPLAHQVLDRLIGRADIVVQNLAPGALDRLGFGAETLRAARPRLIVCGISGYGTDGPFWEKKAYDLLIQCETGLLSVTGTPESPAKVGVSIADISAGMYAFSNILTALYARERTGQGTVIEISMFDTLAEWMSAPLYYAAYGGAAPTRTGPHHATIAPYGPFTTKDGREVFLAVQNEREWTRFCAEVLERPELAADARFASNVQRIANRHALETELGTSIRMLTATELRSRLDNAQIANASLNTLQDVWDHRELSERDRWREVQSPAGALRTLLPPVGLAGVEVRMEPVPDTGEHTALLLEELGYSAEDIRHMANEGAI